MRVPEYVTKEEVQRVCRELGISDWSCRSDDVVDPGEAEIILSALDCGEMAIPLETFVVGLGVELEHGIRFVDANVTNNHPLLTGKIVVAHLKETMDYYKRLLVAELEGDLLKAIQSGNPGKTVDKYKRLCGARQDLDRTVTVLLDR